MNARAPVLHASAKPALTGCSIRRICGPKRASAAAVPSVDPSSTTTMVHRQLAGGLASSACRHAPVRAAPL